VHFGNDPEDPVEVARMLDKYPNLYIDTAARVPEIGRQDADKMRRFYIKYQDRILFGTDTGVGESQEEMMYGSTGHAPHRRRRAPLLPEHVALLRDPGQAVREPHAHPGPLEDRRRRPPDEVLRKLYYDNAARLLHWKPNPVGTPAHHLDSEAASP
jgi:predicted TIM-barrel fold metal-dependent hydrolase